MITLYTKTHSLRIFGFGFNIVLESTSKTPKNECKILITKQDEKYEQGFIKEYDFEERLTLTLLREGEIYASDNYPPEIAHVLPMGYYLIKQDTKSGNVFLIQTVTSVSEDKLKKDTD